LPNSELLVAAVWAVSPDGANILVLLFAGCSVLAGALRLEKRPPADEAGVPEDWPNSDIVEGAAGAVSTKSSVPECLPAAGIAFKKFRAR